jgi:hypothetical protein
MEAERVSTRRSVGAVASVEQLCQWWTQATQGERFRLLKHTIEGDENAPPLKVLQLAIYLAEVEAGEVSQG